MKLTNCTNGTASTMLVLDSAQSVSNGHDFFISLPAADYTGMELTFYQPDGSYCTMVGTVTIKRSVCTRVSISDLVFSDPEPDLSGEFSIDETRKIRFSRGNLLATTVGSVTTWSFHENQYGMVGTANNINGTCDLFGWSTNGTYYGLNAAFTYPSYPAVYHGDFVEWGTVFGGDSPWRTLTYDEMYYMLSRPNGYDFAQVAGVYGALVYPDGFDWPADITKDEDYTASEFIVLEDAGCVFFPATGYRYGSSLMDCGIGGYYWTSTPADEGLTNQEDLARSIIFGSRGAFQYERNIARMMGAAVRLVMDVQ